MAAGLAMPAGAAGARLSVHRLSLATLVTTMVRMLGPVSAFALALLLARSLGASGAGLLHVSLTLVTAVSIVAKFGLETGLQRFVGAARGGGEVDAVVGVYRQARRLSLLLALVVSAFAVASAGAVAQVVLHAPTSAPMLRGLALVVVPFTVLGVNAAMLKALGRPALGSFFEAVAWPLLTLPMAALLLRGQAAAEAAALAYLLAALAAAVASWVTVGRLLPRAKRPRALPLRKLLASCLPLTGIELMNFALLWTPFALLPTLAGAEEAGFYSAAHRIAAQLGLLMLVVASVAAPRFAAEHEHGQRGELSRLAGHAARAMLLLGLPPALLLLAFGEPLLAMFGEEFVAALPALRVLVAGQLVNLASGPVGYLLAMTGLERPLRNVLLATLALMLPLATLLIPAFGALGAAASVGTAMAFHNLACCRVAATRLGVPFFLVFARRGRRETA